MHSVTRHILSSGLNSEVKILAQYSQPVVVVRFIQINLNYLYVKTDSKKIILVKKYVNHKKSTILVQSPSNLVKMISVGR